MRLAEDDEYGILLSIIPFPVGFRKMGCEDDSFIHVLHDEGQMCRNGMAVFGGDDGRKAERRMNERISSRSLASFILGMYMSFF
jgi:hypothetical protein